MKKILLLNLSLMLVVTILAQPKTHTCINTEGDTLFTFEAHYVWDFSDGMAKFKTVVTDNGERVWRIGFINDKGEVKVPAKYNSKYSISSKFKYGVAWVTDPDVKEFYLIDKEGNRVSEKTYEKVGSFNDSLCAVYEGYNMGFVNTKGEEIIPCEYVGDSWFYEGLVCVTKADSEVEAYGFLNKKGEVVIPFKFHQAGFSGFENGECRVQINGKTHLINHAGEVIFTPTLTNNMEGFSCGLAKAYTKPNRSGFGFFNRNNEWVVKPIYDRAYSFENGRSIVVLNDKYGVIDTAGNYIIALKWDKIFGDCAETGYYTCEKDNIRYYYNCDGEYFTNIPVKQLRQKRDSEYIPYMNESEKWGYLNTDGSIYIPAIYNDADSFIEGKAWVY
jgi:hypothetical protein